MRTEFEMAGKRNAVVDIYKGIGIVLVLMGHIGFGTPSSYISHAFHMPMFFLISGYLYEQKREEPFACWLKKKVKALLVPYMVFGILNYLFWIIIQFQKGDSASITLSPVRHLLFVNTTGLASGSLWFLTALFFTNLIYWVVDRLIGSFKGKGIVAVAVALAGISAARFLPFRLPYAIDAGMVGVGLFFVGILLNKNRDQRIVHHILNLSVWEIIIGITGVCILVYQHDEVNMRTGVYNNIFLFWINAIAGSILVYNVAVQLDKIRKRCSFFEMFIGVGERIGRHSLWYVCMNDLVNVEILYLFSLFVSKKTKLITAVTHSSTLLGTVMTIEIVIIFIDYVKGVFHITHKRCPVKRYN